MVGVLASLPFLYCMQPINHVQLESPFSSFIACNSQITGLYKLAEFYKGMRWYYLVFKSAIFLAEALS